MTDPYASEADTLALIRRDQRSDVEKKLDSMLNERGAWEMGAEPFLVLRQITLEQMKTIESIKQAITDPENQPSQFGTVTMEYMQREIGTVCDELLQVLKELASFVDADIVDADIGHKVRAAIAKAEA